MNDTHRRRFLQSTAALGLLGASGALFAASAKIKPGDKAVLIVVDVQNCFCLLYTSPSPRD